MEIIEKNDRLVYADTGEPVIFYECDVEKNTECEKKMCRCAGTGFCAKTTNPKYRKEGGRAWYAVKKTPEVGEPYWGRYYVEV